ncbi:succinate dehydrogenase, hydrophobic membrane anchor protein [Thioalkalivibrio sp. HK1]|uniref:succinate dehydrogenase, hydrophobic membrane anchor protein n=1 Tax=Thioalkalivibrio sp. HK1 TaxID=1469245 RepID=UPI00046EB261|nr:succinate dehydrogenase, hydrophobic membrane anchor protein [Thioalkalivibrio sp. HK1]
MKDFKSPLSRARGLGSARSGTSHWWSQRISAIALIPLGLWLCLSLVMIASYDHAQAVEWIRSPINGIGLTLAIIALFYHASLGLQTIAEDYLSAEWLKIGAIIVIRLSAIALSATAVFSVLRIALGE